MGWNWEKEHLDLVLDPSGLLVIFGYHTFFLYRCLKLPHTTAICHHNHCRAAWIGLKECCRLTPRQALSVISSNKSAAMSLSSICLVLSSQIETWIRTSDETIFKSNLIYGDMNESIIAIKHITLFISFLVGFAAFVQTTRCFVNANFLVTMPTPTFRSATSNSDVCFLRHNSGGACIIWTGIQLRCISFSRW